MLKENESSQVMGSQADQWDNFMATELAETLGLERWCHVWTLVPGNWSWGQHPKTVLWLKTTAGCGVSTSADVSQLHTQMGGEGVTHSHCETRQDKEMQAGEGVMRDLGVISTPGIKDKTQVCQLVENAK
ncbi:hypothetical protein AAES_04452 [Amazona aestiva]|uniref:Uncharacterized protein n=1 Tax=Amazona aestiva TaxID=12930 RepID=A0A0Q3X925_AMAAE|nr:hypothetical protein AAES_04452 [Amazona aestiva]